MATRFIRRNICVVCTAITKRRDPPRVRVSERQYAARGGEGPASLEIALFIVYPPHLPILMSDKAGVVGDDELCRLK